MVEDYKSFFLLPYMENIKNLDEHSTIGELSNLCFKRHSFPKLYKFVVVEHLKPEGKHK